MRKVIPILLLICLGCLKTPNNYKKKIIDDTHVSDTIRFKKLPKIGDRISDSVIQTSKNIHLLVSSAQTYPSTSIYFQECIFDIGFEKFDPENRILGGKVKYIQTRDSNFRTSEGVKINMTLKELKHIQDNKIIKEPGWAYYMELNSGWKVAFFVDETSTGRELLDSDSIKWIFNR
ncbi:MAG: hypothetical protein JXA16_15015 [Bacteroidales bacterium]|nr:hypothetical protein [Bacteroidales bacterium]